MPLYSEVRERPRQGQMDSNQISTASFRQIYNDSRVNLGINNQEEMGDIYSSQESLDRHQAIRQDTLFCPDQDFGFDAAQEPSEFTIPGETYEMVQNKGVGKRKQGSKNTQHKRNRDQFQISDDALQSEQNQLDQLFSNQILLTRQSMSEEHSSRMKQ